MAYNASSLLEVRYLIYVFNKVINGDYQVDDGSLALVFIIFMAKKEKNKNKVIENINDKY